MIFFNHIPYCHLRDRRGLISVGYVSLPHLDPRVRLDEVPLPPLLALGPLGGVRVVRGEGGQLRPPAELGAGLAVARGQLGVAPEKLAGWKGIQNWIRKYTWNYVPRIDILYCDKS